jgi:tRNA(fMet)-specific endonuclease VapC
MIRYVLDSDILSLWQRGDPKVTAQVARCIPDEVPMTIVSVEEKLSGWYTLLRRARTAKELVPVYQRMSEAVRSFAKLPVLTFTDTAANIYEQLRAQKRRRGRMDLRIAAIVLAHHAAIVSRNADDFREIEGLDVLDWSR